MNPADFLAQLAARGVVVATDGADLLFEGPDAVLTEVVSCRGFPPPVLWPGTREEWAAGVSLAEVRPDASCAVGRTVRRTEGEAVAV